MKERTIALAVLCALTAAPFAVACGGAAEQDDSPSAVLSDFLEAMDRGVSSDGALADAYALLDRTDQRALSARAEHAELVTARDFEPWQMLVQGRFRLRFTPAERGGMTSRVRGDGAVVRVVSEDGSSRAEVPMVRQEGRWRVQLGVPAVTSARERAEP